ILEYVVAENGDVDFSITDQPQFNKKEQNATSDNPLTSVDLLCTGKNDLDSLAKLPAGEYTLYYTALPKNMQLESSNPEDPNSPMVPLASEEYKFDRKAVNLTIKERNSNEEIPLTPIEPADPIVPDNPNNNNNSNNNNVSGTETPDLPKTGDTSKTNLLFYILVASGGLAIFSFSKKAKKKIIE
ncbi:MAG: LPXTG cell wall anchor domain-containing protein, partial [Clostridium paraputrificum]